MHGGPAGTNVFGRTNELTLFSARLAAAVEGHGSFVLVEGEAGIGKSTLLWALRAEAQQRGVGIGIGHAAPFADGRPLGLLSDALGIHQPGADGRRKAIADLLRDVAGWPLDHGSALFLVNDALLGLVEELAAERPQLLVLEDLHWADAQTINGLWLLQRRLAQLPVLVVATCRPWPKSPELVSFSPRYEGAGSGLIRLGPLDAAAVDQMVVAATGARPGASLQQRLAGAQGNPFLVSTVLDALAAQAGLIEIDGLAEVSDTVTMGSVHEALVAWLVSLPDGDLELLSRLALLGRGATVDELAAVAGRTNDAVVATLEAGLLQGLLIDVDGGVEFRHELVREAVVARLEPTLRAHLHHEIGVVLAARHAPAGVVAAHLSVGAQPGDERAIEWLRRSAREQFRTNPVAAVAALERAAQLATHHPEEVELLAELCGALLRAQRPREVDDVAQRALRLGGGPMVRAELMLCLGEARSTQGDANGALTYMEQAAQVAGLPVAQRARIHADLAATRVLASASEGTREAAEAAIVEGGAAGLPGVVAVGWSTMARLQTIDGSLLDALHSTRRAFSLAESGGDRRWLPFHRLMAGMAYCAADRFDEGRAILEQGCIDADAVGDVVSHMRLLAALATHALYEGELDEVVEHAELALSIGADLESARLNGVGHAMLGLVAFYRDDIALARHHLARGMAELVARSLSGNGVVHLAVLQVRLALSVGQSDHDLDEGMRMLRALAAHTLHGAPTVVAWFAIDLVEGGLLAGDAELVAEVVAAMEKNAIRTGTVSDRTIDLVCRGIAEGDLGLLMDAAQESCGSPRLLERARAHERAGRMAAAARHPMAANLLGDAMRYWDQMGGVRQVRLVEEFADANGIRLSNRPAKSRARTGWSSLTAAEREVLALVGQGLSNPAIAERLYVSRRTIETHVSRLYAKLGIVNRVLLAAEAQRRGLRPAR